MIRIRQHGDFSKTLKYLEKIKSTSYLKILETYGKKGVTALAAATPVDSGLTASSWGYIVTRKADGAVITFTNSNIVDGVPIAIILQYGHATRNGGWVEGRDYINPAIRPVFDELAENAWREVTKL